MQFHLPVGRACALMALDAQLTLVSTRGERQVALDTFYTTDGIKPFDMQPDELLTRIDIPVIPGAVSAYERLSYRSAIDYPIVCAGVRLVSDPDDAGTIQSAGSWWGHGPVSAVPGPGIPVPGRGGVR